MYFKDGNWVLENMAWNKTWKDIVGEANYDRFNVPYCHNWSALTFVVRLTL